MRHGDFFFVTTISEALAIIEDEAGSFEHSHFMPALREAAEIAATTGEAYSVLHSGDPYGPTGYTVLRDDAPDVRHSSGLTHCAHVSDEGRAEVWGHCRNPDRAADWAELVFNTIRTAREH